MSMLNLRTILTIDGITCTGAFLLSLFAAVPAASLLGLPVIVVTVAGWICLASALVMFVAAGPRQPNPALAKLIALGNVAWVVVSFGAVAFFASAMSGVGIGFVVAQAFAVLGFAVLEARGAAVPIGAVANA